MTMDDTSSMGNFTPEEVAQHRQGESDADRQAPPTPIQGTIYFRAYVARTLRRYWEAQEAKR